MRLRLSAGVAEPEIDWAPVGAVRISLKQRTRVALGQGKSVFVFTQR